MSSCCYGGSVLMKPEIENEAFDPMHGGGYPHTIPKVYLEGYMETYFPQYSFDWDDDSIIVVRDKLVVKYTSSSFVELLAKNEDGELVWMDGRRAPYSSCWDGEYLNEERGAQEYTVEEYNLETYKKKKYKVVLEEEDLLDNSDLRSLYKFLDEKTILSHFEIKDGVLVRYCGEDIDLVIPDDVTEIAADSLKECGEFNSVVIPKTVTKIPRGFCRTEHLEVAQDNPKYYVQDGCLIDREEKTLVWAHAGSTIPDDGSVEKIGREAFEWRHDIESIVIPETITEIGDDAFKYCYALKEVVLPTAFVDEAQRIFGGTLVKNGNKWSLSDKMFCGFSF